MHLFLADSDTLPFLTDELLRAASETNVREVEGLGIAAEVDLDGLLLAFARQTLPDAVEVQAASINAWADGVCACYRTGPGAECAQKLKAPEFPYRATDNFIDNPDRPADTQARKRALDCENASRAGGSR